MNSIGRSEARGPSVAKCLHADEFGDAGWQLIATSLIVDQVGTACRKAHSLGRIPFVKVDVVGEDRMVVCGTMSECALRTIEVSPGQVVFMPPDEDESMRALGFHESLVVLLAFLIDMPAELMPKELRLWL